MEKTYRDCEITRHKDGTFSVYGENIMDMGGQIRYTKSTLAEIYAAVDNAYTQAKGKADKLQSHGVQAMEAHNKVGEYNALARENGRKAIEAAANAGANLNAAKGILHRGQWLPWLEKNCPAISESTARNYMKVAKSVATNPQALADCSSLMEAYVILGIASLRKRKAVEPKTSTASTGNGSGNNGTTSTVSTGAGSSGTVDNGNGESPEVTAIEDATAEDLVGVLMQHLEELDDENTNDGLAIVQALDRIQPIIDWYNEHKAQLKANESRKEVAA